VTRPSAKLFTTRDGLVLCEAHFSEAFAVMTPPWRFRPRGDANGGELVLDGLTMSVLKPSCAMCSTPSAPGRSCERCDTPLHERWPAVYCSNECAIDDA